MPNSFKFFCENFVKYFNVTFRHKQVRSSIPVLNCIILENLNRSLLESNENNFKPLTSLSSISNNVYEQIIESLYKLWPGKFSYAEENKEQKECCETCDTKDLVMTDKAFEKIKFEIETYQVVLFMKGNARKPSCGFSKQALEILKALKIDTIRTVNVLEDQELRNGLKVYSNYPNFPQLYVRGKFVGGLEKISKMFSDGSLKKLIRDG